MKKRGLLSLCALVMALVLAFPVCSSFAENNAYVKYTTAGKINLRAGTSSSTKVLAAIAPGTPLEVLNVYGKWAHVIVANPDGYGTLEGYMFTDYIEYTTYQPVSNNITDTTNYYQNSTPIITENTTMYVNTGNGGNLNLRETASQNVRSLGLFPNGTKVTVLNRSGSWAYVYVNGLYGYMLLSYLSTSPYNPAPQPISGAVKKYVSTGNSGKLHLRESASQNSRSLGLFPNGTEVSAIDLGNGWSFVNVNGLIGYMMTCYLSSVQPYVPTTYTVMYVNTGSSAKLNLRSAMSQSASSLGSYANGTPVYVIATYGSWCYVTVDNLFGYMPANCLKSSPDVPKPGTPIGTATVVHPNGSFVYLRSSRSTSSLDNVLAKVPSGAKVTVYQRDEWYSLVQYNGITGYMVSHYLEFGSSSSGTDNTVIKMIVGGASLRSSRDESISSNILMELPHGTLVSILLTYPDNWRYIEYNGVKGYIHGENVATVSPGTGSTPVQPSVPSGGEKPIGKAKTICSTYLCRRTAQSAAADNVLADIPEGATVELLSTTTSGGVLWYKARYNGLTGYVISQVLDLTGSGSGSASQSANPPVSIPSFPLMPATPTVPAGEVIGTGVVWHPNGSFVNLRYSRSTADNSNILVQVPYGSKLDVMESEGNWTKVRYNGTVGYMVSDYVYVDKKVNASPSSTSAPVSIPSFPLTPAKPTSTEPAAVSIPSVPLMPAMPNNQSGYPSSTRVVRNDNSSFVYLRSTKDSSSDANTLMKVPNGTQVQLVQSGKQWSLVRVENLEGYIASAYLKRQ